MCINNNVIDSCCIWCIWTTDSLVEINDITTVGSSNFFWGCGEGVGGGGGEVDVNVYGQKEDVR